MKTSLVKYILTIVVLSNILVADTAKKLPKEFLSLFPGCLSAECANGHSAFSSKQFDKAKISLEKAIKNNPYDKGSYFYLGNIYQYGKGSTKKNEKKAYKLYLEGAILNTPNNQFAVAECYRYGTGVEKNINQAKTWHEKAIANNYGASMLNLAIVLATGESGIGLNKPQALDYLEKCMRLKNEHAQVRAKCEEIRTILCKGNSWLCK